MAAISSAGGRGVGVGVGVGDGSVVSPTVSRIIVVWAVSGANPSSDEEQADMPSTAARIRTGIKG
jgi:hypothetical protein